MLSGLSLISVINYVKSYWKEVLLGLIILVSVFYIWNLHRKYDNALEEISNNKLAFQKQVDISIMKLKDQELKIKDLEHKYHVETLKERIKIKEIIKEKIKVIQGEDTKTIIVLDANCSQCFKDNYNENSIIKRTF